jgi:cytochrome c peroxidase
MRTRNIASLGFGTLLVLLLLIGFSRSRPTLDERLQRALEHSGVGALEPGPAPAAAKVALGRALFFDKILSGNKDISCATCHHPRLHTGDGLSLSIGTGGSGFGSAREMGGGRGRIPRNSTEIFNRGSPEWRSLFWDGRVSGSAEEGFLSFAGDLLPEGLEGVLAVQAIFPVTSRHEMRGLVGDRDVFGETNELALLDDDEYGAIWKALTARLLKIPEYARLFEAAYPGVAPEELGFQHAANAIAAFEIEAWTLLDSPWDRYLGGDRGALTTAAKRGALLFYGKAGCGACHSGDLLTDQEHHNIGVPQLGPGKGVNAPLDLGRYYLSGEEADSFAFRTPPLRNVALTGPWMHNGAYARLEDAVRHHLNPPYALRSYDASRLERELQASHWHAEEIKSLILATLDPLVAEPLELSTGEVADLMVFLEALTDPQALDLDADIPEAVPSGLPVED